MNEENNITDASLTPEGDGGAAVGADVSQLTLEEINAQLGKQFDSKEAALKAIKDTFSYVGKKKEDIAKEFEAQPSDKFVSREEFLKATFYAENPEFKPYQAIISKLGSDPREVIKDETFKQIYEKAKGFEQIETSKSVLHSNPRLSKVTDNLQEAREAAKNGDYNTAQNKAVEGVIDAFGLRG